MRGAAKKILVVFLSMTMILSSMTFFSFAEATSTNLSATASEENVMIGDTFTVTMAFKGASITSFTGGISFDKDVVEYVSYEGNEETEPGKVYLEKTAGGKAPYVEVEAKLNQETNDKFGLDVPSTTEYEYKACDLVTITFRAIAKGDANIKLYEDTDGTDEFKGENIDPGFSVAVKNPLESIAVTTAPTKTSYCEGQTFDKAGMVVTATYYDSTTAVVTDYTLSPSDELSTSDNKVTISYTEDGITKTTEQAITVSKHDYELNSADGKGWHWGSGYSTATVDLKCKNCDKEVNAVNATVESKIETAATCTEAGVTKYTAKAIYNGQTFTDTEHDYSSPAALGHSYKYTWKWSADHSTANLVVTCNRSDCDFSQTIQATVTSEETKAATCTTAGETKYTAVATFEGEQKTTTYVDSTTPAKLGHDMVEHEAVAATCEEAGNTAYWYCERCQKYFSDEEGNTRIKLNSWVIEPLGHLWQKESYNKDTGELKLVCVHDSTHTKTEAYSTESKKDTDVVVGDVQEPTSEMRENGIETVDDVVEALSEKVAENKRFKNADKRFVEADLLVNVGTEDDPVWVIADKEIFPEDGIVVKISWETLGDVDRDGIFVVAHMYSETMKGADGINHTAGDVEIINDVTTTDEGIEFKVYSLSPFEIAVAPACEHLNTSDVVTKKATTTEAGTIEVVCDNCSTVLEEKAIPKIATISLSKDSFEYDTEAKEPEVSITDSEGNALVKGEDYTVSYSNNVYVGNAKCTVIFKGKYDGEVEKAFTIERGTPSYTVPEDLTATYGDKLSSVDLPDNFAWANGKQTVGNVGTKTFKAIYVPEDTDNYKIVKNIDIQVDVAKAIVKAGTVDTLEATCNETLSKVALPAGYSWNDGTQSVGTADGSVKYFKATLKATDTVNYSDNTDVTIGVRVKHGDSKTEITKAASTTEEGTIRVYCAECNATIEEETIPVIAIHELAKTSVKYDGEELKPAVIIKDSEGNALAEGKDYVLAYADNVNVGTASVTITYKGRYTGEETLSFAITAIAGAQISLSRDEYIYDGTQKTPNVTVKNGSKTLTSGTDYNVAYSDNVNAGTAKATVTLMGNYEGTVEKSFLIVPADNSKVSVSLDKTTAVYTGSEVKPAVTVTGIGSEALVEGEDYTLTYSDNVNVGTASATVTLTKNYVGEKSKTYKITAADGSGLNMTLSDTEYVYSGKALKPHPIIIGPDGRELTKGKDFTVDYSNNINAGTATATVSFIGNYSGTASKTFTILQADGTVLDLQMSDGNYVYDGTAKTPHPIITGIEGNELTKGKDFTVTYSDNTNAGTATATITFKGNYSGTVQKTFTIKALSVGVELLQTSFKYKGEAIEPEFEIQASAGLSPVEGTDYTVTYSDNDTYGTGHIIVTFNGNYSGTIDKEFEIIRTFNLEGSVTGCAAGTEVDVIIKGESGSETKITTENGKYSFKWLDGGNYTISVKGTGDYVTHEYTKSIDNDYLTEALEIRELGDVNCDGVRSAEDITRLARHVAKISEESDPYRLLLYNADRSTVGSTAASKIDAADITHLARFVAKIIDVL